MKNIHYNLLIEPYIDLFNELCNQSSLIRRQILNILMSQDFYAKKISEEEKWKKFENSDLFIHSMFLKTKDLL